MKYIRWVLASTLICGVGYAGQVLAGSDILPDTNNSGIGDQTKGYVFSGQVSNTANCQGMDTCPNIASPADTTTMTVISNDKGQLLTITLTASNHFPAGPGGPFINRNNTSYPSDGDNWGYFVHSGGTSPVRAAEAGKSAPGINLYQIVRSPYLAEDGLGMDQGRQTGQGGALTARDFVPVGATTLGDVVTAGVKTSTNGEPKTYDFSKPSPGGNTAIDDTDNDMGLVLGVNDTNSTVIVKKPKTTTLLLIGTGTIVALVLFGMVMAGFASRSAKERK